MKNPKYPQDVTDDEAELEFVRLIIPSIQDRDRYADAIGASEDWPFVVAMKLSSSAILLKEYDIDGTRVVYTHQVYGTFGNKLEAFWTPVASPVKDPGIYIQEFKSGAIDRETVKAHGFKELEFRHRKKRIFRG
jgi:hypothetical protein